MWNQRNMQLPTLIRTTTSHRHAAGRLLQPDDVDHFINELRREAPIRRR
jgi:hypothetical protein